MNREVEITAYALGELDDDAARALEPTLTDDERAEIAEIRSLAGLLATAPRPDDGLDVGRQAAIDAALSRPEGGARPAHRARRRRPLRWILASASVAAGVLVVASMTIVRSSYEGAMYAPAAELPNARPTHPLTPAQRRYVAERIAEAQAQRAAADPRALRRRNDPTAGYRSANREPAPDDDVPSYDRVLEHGFSLVKDRPVTTFAVDVDTASYANVRRHLMKGERPPRDAVRVEEMINYFAYDLPEPTGAHPLAILADVTDAPWNPDHLVARVALSAKSTPKAQRRPANLVFLIDVSCSMGEPNKLPLVKTALAQLVRSLSPRDRVAVVSYASTAKTVLPSTSAANRIDIDRAIERLVAGGSTNGAAGLWRAYAIASGNHIEGGINRVVVATDGGFNEGPTGRDQIVALIQKQRARNTFLTVLGLGDDIEDGLLKHIADRDDGQYHVIDNAAEAKKVLSDQLGSTLEVVAKDVKVQLELNPRRVAKYRLIGYDNRRLANADFANDAVDGGEVGAGHTVTMLYELVPAPARDDQPLLYQDPEPVDGVDKQNDLFRVRVRYQAPHGDRSTKLERSVHSWKGHHVGAAEDLRFATAVAAFGMRLADSPHQGRISYDAIAKLARGALGADPGGRRREFVELVQRAARLD